MFDIILRVIDIVLGAIGLLLIIRVLLYVFRVSQQNPGMRILTAITDPVIQVVKHLLGIPSYRSLYVSTPSLSTDILHPLVALIAIWVLRTILVWTIGLIILFPVWARDPVAHLEDMLRHFLSIIFSLYINALFIRILLQWLQVPYSSGIMRFLWTITEPVLAPIRHILPPMMGFDLSPLVAFFLLRLLEGAVLTLLSWIF
jgi:YggT family protein